MSVRASTYPASRCPRPESHQRQCLDPTARLSAQASTRNVTTIKHDNIHTSKPPTPCSPKLYQASHSTPMHQRSSPSELYALSPLQHLKGAVERLLAIPLPLYEFSPESGE